MLRVGEVQKYFLNVHIFNKQENCAFISVSASTLLYIFYYTLYTMVLSSSLFVLPLKKKIIDVSQNLR